MATTATSISDWTGSINGGIEFADTVAGKDTPASDEVYKREIYIVNRHRFLFDITTFTPQGGDEAGAGLTIKSGGDTLTPTSTKKYICTADNVVPTAEGIDLWREDQAWKSYGDWAIYTPVSS